jgi:hypothetical protein
MRRIHPGPLEIERQYNESQMSERSGKSPALTLSRVRMRKDQHNRGRRRIEPSRSIYESRQSGHLGGMLQPERRFELVQDDLALALDLRLAC